MLEMLNHDCEAEQILADEVEDFPGPYCLDKDKFCKQNKYALRTVSKIKDASLDINYDRMYGKLAHGHHGLLIPHVSIIQ